MPDTNKEKNLSKHLDLLLKSAIKDETLLKLLKNLSNETRDMGRLSEYIYFLATSQSYYANPYDSTREAIQKEYSYEAMLKSYLIPSLQAMNQYLLGECDNKDYLQKLKEIQMRVDNDAEQYAKYATATAVMMSVTALCFLFAITFLGAAATVATGPLAISLLIVGAIFSGAFIRAYITSCILSDAPERYIREGRVSDFFPKEENRHGFFKQFTNICTEDNNRKEAANEPELGNEEQSKFSPATYDNGPHGFGF